MMQARRPAVSRCNCILLLEMKGTSTGPRKECLVYLVCRRYVVLCAYVCIVSFKLGALWNSLGVKAVGLRNLDR